MTIQSVQKHCSTRCNLGMAGEENWPTDSKKKLREKKGYN